MRFQAFKVALLVLIASFSLVFVSSCVEDQQFIALRNNVDTLNKRVSVLERDVSSLREELRDLRGTSTVKLDILSKDVEDLKGALQEEGSKTDEQYYSLLKRVDALEKSLSEIRRQLTYMKGARESLAVSGESVPPLPVKGKVQVAPSVPASQKVEAPKESPESLYAKALNLYRNGDIEGARSLFEKFLSIYPSTGLSDNALFWLGETYYVEGRYPEAIVRYQEVLTKYPRSDKVPSALLKMAFSQEKLGNATDAQVTLKRLVYSYPDTPQARIAKKELEKIAGKGQKGSK